MWNMKLKLVGNMNPDELSNDWRAIQNAELFSALYWRVGATVGVLGCVGS
jgi:hypothetical protein